MIHKEEISLNSYADDFGVPFLKDFAKACREHIVIGGVKKCFIVKCPFYLEGEIKTSPILFQYKGNRIYECKHDKFLFTFLEDEDLKERFYDQCSFTRFHIPESKEYQYGIRLKLAFPHPYEYTLTFQPIVNGKYRIESLDCSSYVDLPNVHTRYAVQQFIDLIQEVYKYIKKQRDAS